MSDIINKFKELNIKIEKDKQEKLLKEELIEKQYNTVYEYLNEVGFIEKELYYNSYNEKTFISGDIWLNATIDKHYNTIKFRLGYNEINIRFTENTLVSRPNGILNIFKGEYIEYNKENFLNALYLLVEEYLNKQ